jgi:hypothetical protein
MKSVARLLSAPAVLVLAVGSAAAASLDRDGTWAPSEFYQSQGPTLTRGLVNDGSFEQGPPPASAWTEVSNSPLCEWIGDFSGQWYVSAWHGYQDYWAGGYCLDELGVRFAVTSSVTQTVHVPADSTRLTFYYVSFRPDLDDDPFDGDHVYVAVNGSEVWAMEMTRANDTYPYWTGPVLVDLAAYGGQDISLSFGGISVGELTGNVRFDYIVWEESGPTPAEASSWGSIKERFR